MRRIRDLTARIGSLKGRPDPGSAIERARTKRADLAGILARDHGRYMLINPEGRTEFVGREEFVSRVTAWLRRRDADAGPEFYRAALN